MRTKIDFNKYGWLLSTPNLPRMIQEAIALGKLNTNEIPGPKSSQEIMKMADYCGVRNIYTNDDIAWCALAQTYICLKAGKEINFKSWDRLRAKSFLKFGKEVVSPMLGDVLVFTRTGGAHVGMYIGEDEVCYHVAGGNQSNQFNITRILKSRLSGVRRPHYNNTPAAVKPYKLSPNGLISFNEA